MTDEYITEGAMRQLAEQAPGMPLTAGGRRVGTCVSAEVAADGLHVTFEINGEVYEWLL